MMISRVSRLIFYLEIRIGSSAQAKVEFSSKIVVYIFILFLAGVFILVIYSTYVIRKRKKNPFLCAWSFIIQHADIFGKQKWELSKFVKQ